MRQKNSGNYAAANGAQTYVSQATLETVSQYIIYIFISDTGLPPSGGNNYPVKSSGEANGAWYMLDTLSADQTMASLRVPQNKTVML